MPKISKVEGEQLQGLFTLNFYQAGDKCDTIGQRRRKYLTTKQSQAAAPNIYPTDGEEKKKTGGASHRSLSSANGALCVHTNSARM